MTSEELKHKLNQLNAEHRALDEEIACLLQTPQHDQFATQRLKKKKLYLKDRILHLKTKIHPNIIA